MTDASRKFLLSSAAKAAFVDEIVEAGEEVAARIRVSLDDGQTWMFRVAVAFASGVAVVRGTDGSLPKACPERHINKDGSFCLGWQIDGPKRIESEGDGDALWSSICGFLYLQTLAAVTGRWPASHQWPHGNAARFQFQIEQLIRDDIQLATLSNDAGIRVINGRLENRRGKCPCGSGSRGKDCHERKLIRVADLKEKIASAERDFWHGWRDVECCGTMKNCHLAEKLT